jgi:hypothetical protein
VISGQLISRTGRYRLFPIAGTVLVVAGFWLVTRMNADTSTLTASENLLVIGFGMGLISQTYILAVQNAVQPNEIGIATASILFFRSIGGTFAVAAFGSLLTSELRRNLSSQLGPAARSVDPQQLLQSPAAAQELPARLVHGVEVALASSLHSVFVACVPITIAALLLSFLLKELPLRTQRPTDAPPEATGAATNRRQQT